MGITSQDPKYENINDKLYALIIWLCPAISLLLMITCYGKCLGWEVNIARYVMMGTGSIFMVIVTVMVFVPTVYSFLHYRKNK